MSWSTRSSVRFSTSATDSTGTTPNVWWLVRYTLYALAFVALFYVGVWEA